MRRKTALQRRPFVTIMGPGTPAPTLDNMKD